jgi:formylglycine-generating enzyme required for sulfatase activity
MGFAAIWIVAALALVIFITAGIWWFSSNNQNTQSQLDSLKSQITQMEEKYKSTGLLSDQDKATLATLETSVKNLQDTTTNLPQDTKTDIADLSKRVDALKSTSGRTGQTGTTGPTGSQGIQGMPGLQGQTGFVGADGSTGAQGIAGVQGIQGATGATGSQGLQGIPGSNDCIAGVCVSRQATSGTPETGNINITGGVIASTLQGNGASVTNVNAVTLQGNAASYFTNATNLASGTVADARLSTNVALLNANQTFTGTMLINTAGTALTVTNTASIGTLTVVASAGIGGSLAVTGSITGASLSVTGTVTAASYAKSCPTGYVLVPGNPKFGTTDFCVMKYEAKNDGSNNAVSTATGTPWGSISQRGAEDTSAAAGGHLITEPEWMTIATNALWQPANWCNLNGTSCGNAPGTAGKYLATGHQDGTPNAALAATNTDSDACYGTVTADVSTACGAAGTQKRTLTLSNGSVIWDIPGNVWEWTDSWIIGGDQPTTGTPGFNYREYTAITKWQALNYANPTNRGWSSAQRLGQIYSDGTSTNTTLYSFIRGGSWNDGTPAGAFALNLGYTPTVTGALIGFRVAR